MQKLAAALSLLTFPLLAQDEPPIEFGAVDWLRDVDAAFAKSKDTNKPVFLLFQEVPGCSTCTGFGRDVLSHPLLQEAIEDAFVPVLVRNNVDGEEGKVRERFEEPPWNNPVVRFVDATGKDLIPRKDGVWDANGIAQRMVATLQKAKRPVPGYLTIALQESAKKTATAVFQMHCYWEGEALLGALDGVVKTTSAWKDGAEVVEVVFLPEVISAKALRAKAEAKSCRAVDADGLKVAKASDQQHSLGGTVFEKLKLTPMQRTKVHAALTQKRDAMEWLTPSQRARVKELLAAKK